MNSSVRSGWGLLWRHQRLIWWIFAVNLLLAWMSSWSVRAMLGNVLGHSLASASLVSGFDLGTLVTLLGRPDVQFYPLAPAMAASALVMLIYLLFIDGGVITVYLEDRKLRRSEFFENSGLFFWRMVRLAIYSLFPFGIVAAVQMVGSIMGGKLSEEAGPDRLGFYAQLAGMVLAMLLGILVRLWFDLTQARLVCDNERRLLRTLLGSFGLAFSSGLYLRYLGIGAVGGLVFVCGGWAWLNLPHEAMAASLMIWELVLFWAIATRLWMKATSARWVSLLPPEVLPAPMAYAPQIVLEPQAEVVEPAPPAPSTPEEEPPVSE